MKYMHTEVKPKQNNLDFDAVTLIFKLDLDMVQKMKFLTVAVQKT